MSLENIFTFIIVIVVLFLLIYNKTLREFFNETIDDIEINVSLKNNILWTTNNLENITSINKGTFFIKSKDLILSNENITRNFKYNGIIFKPNKNLENIKVGLFNNNMTHYYDITQNNTFSIKELKEEEIQNIDFCSSSILKKCMNKTNLYNYNQNDYLGIMICIITWL